METRTTSQPGPGSALGGPPFRRCGIPADAISHSRLLSRPAVPLTHTPRPRGAQVSGAGDRQDQNLTDQDPYDPGDGSLPVFEWKQAGHTNLATRRQLRAMGLRPGGQEPVARIECRGGQRFAWLYRVDLAKPKRTPTLVQEEALDRAMAARQTCPKCLRRYAFCLPLKTLGTCLECHDGTPADPGSYITEDCHADT